jgi:hypothetical protein
MVDIVRFNTGVESFLPDFDRLYKGVFPKEANFQIQGEAIERHMTTIFEQYASPQEKLLKALKPYTYSAAITTPGRYQNYLNTTQGIFRAHSRRVTPNSKQSQSRLKKASNLLKTLQDDAHLLNMYMASTIQG